MLVMVGYKEIKYPRTSMNSHVSLYRLTNRMALAGCILLGFACSDLSAETKLHPEEWLEEHLSTLKSEGWEVSDIYSDVVKTAHPAMMREDYYLRIEGEPMISKEWRSAAYAGRNYPAARRPLDRLARGWMLYESRLAPAAAHTGEFGPEQQYEKFAEARGPVFKKLQEQGINAVVYLTYMEPKDWPALQRDAEKYDIDLFIQYLRAYYHPVNRADLWSNPAKAHEIRESCLRYLEAIYQNGGERRLKGFSIREEPYLPFLAETQDYHDLLRKSFPDLPIYMLYNRSDPMNATREPAPEIMGHNTSEFLGGFSSPVRPQLAWRTPQVALLANAKRLATTSDPALSRGAVYTYTPVLSGWSLIQDAEKVKEHGWPAENYFGVEKLPDGRTLYWRNYNAPEGTTRAAVWNSVACGAQGWFPWSNQVAMPWLPPDTDWMRRPDKDPAWRHSDQTKVWKEYLAVLRELTPFEPLILGMRLDGLPRVQSDDPLLIATGHRLLGREDDGRVLTLVNLDTGRWPGYPEVDRTSTKNLSIGKHGDLIGYEALKEPRDVRFSVRMRDTERLYDLRTRQPIEPDEAVGKDRFLFTRAIEPGGAGLFFVGDEDAWKYVQSMLGTP